MSKTSNDGRQHDLDQMRVNLERAGICGPQLDQALAEIRDSLWLAAHDEAIARRAKAEALRDAAKELPSLAVNGISIASVLGDMATEIEAGR